MKKKMYTQRRNKYIIYVLYIAVAVWKWEFHEKYNDTFSKSQRDNTRQNDHSVYNTPTAGDKSVPPLLTSLPPLEGRLCTGVYIFIPFAV